MSFILEALKKSQQERALGQVPRIDTGLLVEEPAGPRLNPWVGLALGLAFVAVAIALVALWRVVAQPTTAPSPSLTAPLPDAVAWSSPAPVGLTTDRGGDDRAGHRAQAVLEQGAVDVATETLGLRFGPAAPGAEAPAPTPSAGPAPVSAEPGPTGPRSRSIAAGIPEDLVEEITSFREQIRREQQGLPSRDEVADVEPLRPAEQPTLPAFIMTAHVHDADPQRRFVVINSLRYGEGEQTREGLEVLEIQPDGVWLGYGNVQVFRKP
ncbi:general secretion pathway protein GspB [Thioalkalicoccus limnaeus]|uniref:General secretion pathway protein GspB n=1 Tax=Thioalkalicoccus limnaeus TaxID=120681 RepID=A0ABV4B9B9_9GAMM